MNQVRERILLDVAKSLREFPYAEHKDLISFCVCSECFEDWEEIENGNGADFNDVIAIVDKDWLFKYMSEDMNIENPRKYLQQEYTSDDSIDWFDMANIQGKLMMVAFN